MRQVWYEGETCFCLCAELYEIFLCRAKEKWRSYSETSSVNDSESGKRSVHVKDTRTHAGADPVLCALDGGVSLADRESSLDLIKLDISRTFPALFIFQKVGSVSENVVPPLCDGFPHSPASVWFLQGGPYHDLLHSVLGAYTCYRPDIGYVRFPPLTCRSVFFMNKFPNVKHSL